MTIEAFQKQIENIYYTRDAARGVPLTFTWFVEEVGELAKEIRKQPQDIERLREEPNLSLIHISEPTRPY